MQIKLKKAAKALTVTVKDDIKTVLSSYYAECEDYLVKPISPENLSQALSKIGITA